jgi:hypothetical protein
MKLGRIGSNLQGAGDKIHGCLGLPALTVNHAQKMQSVRVVGLADQNLAIDFIRLGKPPGALMLQAGGDRFSGGFEGKFALRFQWKSRI